MQNQAIPPSCQKVLKLSLGLGGMINVLCTAVLAETNAKGFTREENQSPSVRTSEQVSEKHSDQAGPAADCHGLVLSPNLVRLVETDVEGALPAPRFSVKPEKALSKGPVKKVLKKKGCFSVGQGVAYSEGLAGLIAYRQSEQSASQGRPYLSIAKLLRANSQRSIAEQSIAEQAVPNLEAISLDWQPTDSAVSSADWMRALSDSEAVAQLVGTATSETESDAAKTELEADLIDYKPDTTASTGATPMLAEAALIAVAVPAQQEVSDPLEAESDVEAASVEVASDDVPVDNAPVDDVPLGNSGEGAPATSLVEPVEPASKQVSDQGPEQGAALLLDKDSAVGIDRWNGHKESVDLLSELLSEQNVIVQEDDVLDDELGTLRLIQLRSRDNEELGILRLLQTAQAPPPLPKPPIAFLGGRLGFLDTENAFRSTPQLEDQIYQSGLTFFVFPRISDNTSLFAIAETNLARYSNFDSVNYNEVEVQAGIRQRLLPRTFAQIGWRNQKLYSPGYRERLFSVHYIDTLISHRSIINKKTWLDSFYQMRLGFADPQSASRLRQTFTLSLNYGISRNFRTSLLYQLDFDDYTQVSRFDTYQQVLGVISYNLTPESRVSLFGGTRFGRSSTRGVNLNDTFYGAGLNVSVPLF